MVKKLENIKSIGESTTILFTLKQFISLFIALLGLLFGFYQMVILPKVQSVETQYDKIIFMEQKNHDRTAAELQSINKSIFAIKLNVQELQLTNKIKPISEEQSTKLYNENYAQRPDTLNNIIKNINEFYPSAYSTSKN